MTNDFMLNDKIISYFAKSTKSSPGCFL